MATNKEVSYIFCSKSISILVELLALEISYISITYLIENHLTSDSNLFISWPYVCDDKLIVPLWLAVIEYAKWFSVHFVNPICYDEFPNNCGLSFPKRCLFTLIGLRSNWITFRVYINPFWYRITKEIYIKIFEKNYPLLQI